MIVCKRIRSPMVTRKYRRRIILSGVFSPTAITVIEIHGAPIVERMGWYFGKKKLSGAISAKSLGGSVFIKFVSFMARVSLNFTLATCCSFP